MINKSKKLNKKTTKKLNRKTSKKLNRKTSKKLNRNKSKKLNRNKSKKLNSKTGRGTKRKKTNSSSKSSSSRKKPKQDIKRTDLITLEDIDNPLNIIITKDNGVNINAELDLSKESFLNLTKFSKFDMNNNRYVKDLIRRGNIYQINNTHLDWYDVDDDDVTTQEMNIYDDYDSNATTLEYDDYGENDDV